MTPLEIFENLRKKAFCRVNIERKNSVDDEVRPRLVGGLEVTRLNCGLEGANDYARRVRAQEQRLSVQKCGLCQYNLVLSELNSSTHGVKRGECCPLVVQAHKLAQLDQPHEIGQHGLSTSVFVGTVRMQAVSATACIKVNEWRR